MEAFNSIVTLLDDKVWFILMFLLVGTGVYFSIRTGFVQVRHFPQAWKRVFGGFSLKGDKAGKEGMSSFQALATAIAAQVGTGNIAGCATALVGGGPGAIFWMWLAAFFGMATIYGEACLSQMTKTRDENGHVIGGPVYYITKAFKGGLGKFLAGFFAVAIILALGIMGIMVQSNSISDAFYTAFGLNKMLVGVLVTVIAAFIFVGGIGRIASFTEKVVPVMAALYLVGGLVLLILNFRGIPGALASIFVGAFCPRAVGGAVAGIAVRQAMRLGVARGLFSNEAGMGSTPHAHALAKVDKPQDQGEVAMIGVFIDTFVVLTLNALVIISTLYTADGPLAECGAAAASTTLTKANLAQTAFGTVFGEKFGAMFVAVCLFFFAFSTVLSWNLFGKINANYLFGKKNPRRCTVVYSLIALVFVFIGTLASNDLVWELTDMFNNLMVIPNAIALFALTGMVVAMCKEGKLAKKK